MEVYIARQPIFDRRMKIFGYELLYRKSSENHFPGSDDDRATAELIHNSFLVMGLSDLTDGSKGFINFSKELFTSDLPLLLPPKNVILEILERGESTEAIEEACHKLRSMGYTIALDDFVMDSNFYPLIECVDIIKVEFPSVKLGDQKRLINLYRNKVKFLAEKIETREEYQQALDLGYTYFQGYFFCKPAVLNANEIVSFDGNLLRIAEELNRSEPDYTVIAEIISHDLGLVYKLLKLSNSVAAGSKNTISSVSQAISYLGIREMQQWMSLMLLRNMNSPENTEAVRLSVIRAKLMELLALDLQRVNDKYVYFLTGMFSLIDVLMNRPMKAVMEGLPLPPAVKHALLGEEGDAGRMLRLITDFEQTGMRPEALRTLLGEIEADRFMALYLEALRWTKSVTTA